MLKYTEHAVDICNILTMTSNDIDDLYYIKVIAARKLTQSGQKEAPQVKTDLSIEYKYLITVLISFNR